MTYVYDIQELTDLFSEEVSRAAQMSQNEQGQSLYDHVHDLMQDEGAVRRFIEDGISDVVKRFSDVAYRLETPSSDEEDAEIITSIEFVLPDMPEENESVACDLLTRWISLHAVSQWLREKLQPRHEEYAARVQDAETKAVVIMRQRRRPVRM